jgi:glycosyltransferase involved in cell wall biosynthesis
MPEASDPRVVVVSHPAVVAVNQEVYVELSTLGWDVQLVVPARWWHDYATTPFEAEVHPALEGRVRREPIAFVGSVQRHVYVNPPWSVLRDLGADIVFAEEEYFSVPAAEWGVAARHVGVPFGVQADENLDRALPVPARALRAWTLRNASFLAARSPTAARLARRHGGPSCSAIVPHAVPLWGASPRRCEDVFTVGFAGRLVEEKGVADLLAACIELGPPLRLLVAGDGPMRAAVQEATLPSPGLDLRTGLGHAGMPHAFAEMDVLVLPSRTTTRWAEQFGRVLVEAMSFGIPVIGTDSGEIPWVIDETGGGRVVPEGDVAVLARELADCRDHRDDWHALGVAARSVVDERFSASAAAGSLDRLLHRALDGRA